jgi:hypothetical protein
MTAVLSSGVGLVGAYLGAGFLFALGFAARGAGRLDPVATRGSPGFRILILPGATLLWPLLLAKLLRGGPAPPIERNAHRLVAAAPETRR